MTVTAGIDIRCLFRCLISIAIVIWSGIEANGSPPVRGDYATNFPLDINRSELEHLYQGTLDKGIRNDSLLAAFLLRKGELSLRRGDTDQAVQYAECALKLAPHYPSVYLFLTKALWFHNPTHFFFLLRNAVAFFRVGSEHYFFVLFLLIAITFFLLLAFVASLGIFTLILFYKYFKLSVHDVHHLLLGRVPLLFSGGWCLFIFLLPLFLQWGIVLILFFWLALLFVYLTKRERQLVIFFSLFLVISPLLIQRFAYLVTTASSERLYYLYWVNEECPGPESEQKLIELNARYPDDVDILFSLGLLKKREGKYEEAKRYYERLLEINPSYYRAWCNLGNVQFLRNQVDAAIESYLRCVKLFSADVVAHYNLSRAYLAQYMFEESTRHFSKAKELDDQRVDYFLAIYSSNPNRAVIDETIPLRRWWEYTFSPTEEKYLASVSFWNAFFYGIPFAYRYSVYCIFLLFVSMLFITNKEHGLSVPCEYCGMAICKKCGKIEYESNLCKGCAAVFKRKKEYNLNAREGEKKLVQIERFLKRHLVIGRVCSFFLPGAGHLWMGYIWRGCLLLFVFFFTLFTFIFGKGFRVNPWLINNSHSNGGTVFVSFVLVILYLYSIVRFPSISRDVVQFLSLVKVTRKEFQIKCAK